jgi:hypothetical protein
MSVNVTDKTTDRGGTLMRYELLRDHCQSFASAAAWANDNFNLTGHGEPLHASPRGEMGGYGRRRRAQRVRLTTS